jgi:hypothetical protein
MKQPAKQNQSSPALVNFHFVFGDFVPVNSKKCDAGTRQRPTGNHRPSERKLMTGGPLGRAGGKPHRSSENSFVPSSRRRMTGALVYEVEETMRERTQEVRVEASDDGGRTYRQILIQEYNFSPRGATFQREDQRVDLRQVTHLRLAVVPNKSGSGPATLTTLRLFA